MFTMCKIYRANKVTNMDEQEFENICYNEIEYAWLDAGFCAHVKQSQVLIQHFRRKSYKHRQFSPNPSSCVVIHKDGLHRHVYNAMQLCWSGIVNIVQSIWANLAYHRSNEVALFGGRIWKQMKMKNFSFNVNCLRINFILNHIFR